MRKHDFLVQLYISVRACFLNHANQNRSVLQISRQLAFPGHRKTHISTKWFLDMTRKFETVGMTVWIWTSQKEIISLADSVKIEQHIQVCYLCLMQQIRFSLWRSDNVMDPSSKKIILLFRKPSAITAWSETTVWVGHNYANFRRLAIQIALSNYLRVVTLGVALSVLLLGGEIVLNFGAWVRRPRLLFPRQGNSIASSVFSFTPCALDVTAKLKCLAKQNW